MKSAFIILIFILIGISSPTLANAEKKPPPQPPTKQKPQSGSGSGFFVSKMGHVITNAHVVQNCKKITIGDNANKQVPAEIINTDSGNDLALLKLSTLEMASAESKSLIQKLGIVVVPLASKGLLRSEDVKLGEKVLVAGYPFGDVFSNTIKVTSGIVSATRGAGDDSGQFQLDAAVQPGNSGGPIYDSGGNIVGVVISQLDKLKMAKTIGSLPENVNFGIKASTVRQFLTSSGLPSKKSERTEEKSTEQLAEIAQNQTLMVICRNDQIILPSDREQVASIPPALSSDYDYQLYKNQENYGIVVFPKKHMFKELENYLFSIPFEYADSGKAVMRHGTKNEQATYMMPLEVQKRHLIEKFIVIQVLDSMSMLVGVYDPEWGLTLPSAIVEMGTIRQNIPKTLNVFRGLNRQRQTQSKSQKKFYHANFSSKLKYNIMPCRLNYSN